MEADARDSILKPQSTGSACRRDLPNNFDSDNTKTLSESTELISLD